MIIFYKINLMHHRKTVDCLTNVQYGTASNLNTAFNFNKVTELVRNKQQNTNLMKNKIIIQTNIRETYY